MREILFRGKKIENGEWIFGGYHRHQNRTLYCIGDRVRKSDIEHVIVRDFPGDWGMPCGIDYYVVDPETVGQWIGLNDIEGTKIFEGDILEIRYDDVLHDHLKYYRSVKWFGELGYPVFDFSDSTKLDRSHQMIWSQVVEKAYYRVVGNIYDNPEIFENKEENDTL